MVRAAGADHPDRATKGRRMTIRRAFRETVFYWLWRVGLADESVYWNPYNGVVQSHRDGEIHFRATNWERSRRGLPVPWRPDMPLP